MNKKYITAIVSIILAVLAVLIFGMGKKAEAPVSEAPIISEAATVTQAVGQTVKEFVVEGNNFSFMPDVIKVKRGDKVKITFKNTAGFHDFVIDEFGAATKQGQAPTTEVLEFTADKTGSFEYYCSVGTHRMMGMKGTLIVE